MNRRRALPLPNLKNHKNNHANRHGSIIERYILGYTAQVLAYRAVDTEQFEDVAARFTRGDFAKEFPHFTEHALQHMEPEPGQDDVNAYELGLDMILSGLERIK